MPEHLLKIPQPASPIARSGGGDISEIELSRERYTLQTTPPARVQPPHPKKQLFSAPVNKFTAKSRGPSANLERIRTCLDEFSRPKADATPTRPAAKIGPKALSMEDLTPNKKKKMESSDKSGLAIVRAPGLHSIAEEQAAMIIGRFMLVQTWRRRRCEVRCLRKTLESQVSCSERLRIQVVALKTLLDSDNAKVRLAIRELERLKEKLRDKELEKQVLEREKIALEGDVCAAEDKASEMSIGWRNCRNELECLRAAAAAGDRALQMERAASAEARSQRDHAYARLSIVEAEVTEQTSLLAEAQRKIASLERESRKRQELLEETSRQLMMEQEARTLTIMECTELSDRVASAADEAESLSREVEHLSKEMVLLRSQLASTKEQLDWWPRPLTRMMGAARSFLRHPISIPEAMLWALVPARHGC